MKKKCKRKRSMSEVSKDVNPYFLGTAALVSAGLSAVGMGLDIFGKSKEQKAQEEAAEAAELNRQQEELMGRSSAAGVTTDASGAVVNTYNKLAYGNNQTVHDVGSGGTHEENPNGGVFAGTGANGKPNTVEEGESMFGGNVLSDRLKYDRTEDMPTFVRGETYADAAKSIEKEFEGRFDKYSQDTKKETLERLYKQQGEKVAAMQAEVQGQAPEADVNMAANGNNFLDSLYKRYGVSNDAGVAPPYRSSIPIMPQQVEATDDLDDIQMFKSADNYTNYLSSRKPLTAEQVAQMGVVQNTDVDPVVAEAQNAQVSGPVGSKGSGSNIVREEIAPLTRMDPIEGYAMSAPEGMDTDPVLAALFNEEVANREVIPGMPTVSSTPSLKATNTDYTQKEFNKASKAARKEDRQAGRGGTGTGNDLGTDIAMGVGLASQTAGIISNVIGLRNVEEPATVQAHQVGTAGITENFVNRQEIQRSIDEQVTTGRGALAERAGGDFATYAANAAAIEQSGAKATGEAMLQADIADQAESARVDQLVTAIKSGDADRMTQADIANEQNRAAYDAVKASYSNAIAANFGAMGQSVMNYAVGSEVGKQAILESSIKGAMYDPRYGA